MSALVTALVWCVLGFVAGWFSRITNEAWGHFNDAWKRGHIQGLRDAGRLCLAFEEQLHDQDTSEARAAASVLVFTRSHLYQTARSLEGKVTP